MPVAILMPALSPTMTEGNIAKWLKSVGDNIVSGDIVAEVETDKATMEVEAIEEGKLAKIVYPEESENVPVNELIGVISQEGDSDADVENFIINNKKSEIKVIKDDLKNIDNSIKEEIQENSKLPDNIKSNTEDNNTNSNTNTNTNTNNTIFPERLLISPLAKRIASMKNIDLTNIKGSGPKGRIIKQDLDVFLNKNKEENKDISLSTVSNEQKILKLSSIRKTIASRLQESKLSIPHFYLKGKVEMDNLFKERAKINSFFNKEGNLNKISFNDFFIKAVALSLKSIPIMNSIWNGDGSITQFKNVDLSVAVATEEGLFTPIIKNACTKNLSTISSEMKLLAKKAKEGKLTPPDYTGGSFSISNLGMFGIYEFSAIINPPQSGIIAFGDIIEDVIVKDGQVTISKTMSYTVSVDHRIVDGANASSLLRYFNFFIKNPTAMLV